MKEKNNLKRKTWTYKEKAGKQGLEVEAPGGKP